jgi:hypothetical protein
MLDAEIRRDYPIDLNVAGWFFRCAEIGPGHYVAEGRDVRGASVSYAGCDPDELLSRCKETAMQFESQSRARS